MVNPNLTQPARIRIDTSPSVHVFLLVFSLVTGTVCLSVSSVSATAPGETAGLESRAAEHRGPAGDAENVSFVMVNGVRLAYRIEGAGIPVVFVHGEGYSHELWTEQLDDFSRQYQFLSYDRRGHGLSDDPVTGYSEIAHANDLKALLNFLGIRDAHFVVNSRGGSIILQFLRMFETSVRSITFADATIPLVPISEKSAFKPVIPFLFAPPPSFEDAVRGREGAKTSSFTRVAQSRPDVSAVLERMTDQYSPLVSMNPQRSDMSAPMHIGPWNEKDFPDMSRMSQPILLLVAEHSDIFFTEGAQAAHRLWPNTQFSQIDGTDHLLMLEEPDRFNQSVLTFIAEVEAINSARQKTQSYNRQDPPQ